MCNVEWVKASEGESADKPKRFSMTAYTGGPMMVGYYSYPVVIDLTGLTASAPLPILLNHSLDRIVGHAEEVEKTDSSLKLSGVISGASAESSQVTASASQGFPWKASVGARPDKAMDFVAEGETVRVNGKTIKGPVYVARKATLGEVSFVAMAADGKTSAKVAATAAFTNGDDDMNEFEKWVQALGFNAAELTDAQKTALQAKFNAEVKASQPKQSIEGKAAVVNPPAFDLQGVILAYEKHVATIQAAAAGYAGKIDEAKLTEIKAKASTKAAELKAQALSEEKTAAWLEVELIKAKSAAEVELIRAERPQGAFIHSSTRDLSSQVIEAALCRSRLPDVEKHFKPEVLEAAADKNIRNISLQELLLMAAASNGYNGRQRINKDNLRDVLACAFMPVRAAGGMSTISVSGILSNIANKILLSGFNSVPQTWRMVARSRNVSDFKTVTCYRLTTGLEYEEVGPDGKIKHGTLGEESYDVKAKTYAKMLTLSRQDIINDDLGAFDELRTRLGIGAVLKMNKVFWTKWINNDAFFTADRGNYQSGAETVLGEAGLNTAVKLFRDMKDGDGALLGLEPKYLVVPTDLEATARKLYVSQETRDTTANKNYTTANIYQNKFTPVVVPELSSSLYTGYSAKAWYLLADPAILATAVMCFLDGQESPTIESADADFDTLGIQLRGFHDFGCEFAEWRGGVKSKGEA